MVRTAPLGALTAAALALPLLLAPLAAPAPAPSTSPAAEHLLHAAPAPARSRLPAALVVVAAAARTPAGEAWAPPVWPVRLVRAFDNPRHDWLPGHRGIDLRTRAGDEVRSAGDGRVAFASRLAGRGVVVVDHGVLRTTYEPVAAEVRVGDRVRRGAVLGRVAPGTGHCGAGTCLHLGLRRGAAYLDPRLVLGRRATLLRPW
jgi:murein DD-endopeptidase MepM/ murein hydrolase activator NlpD